MADKTEPPMEQQPLPLLSAEGQNASQQPQHHTPGTQNKPHNKHTNAAATTPNDPSGKPPAAGANANPNNRQHYSGNSNGRYYKNRNYNQKAGNHNSQYSPANYGYPPNMYGTYYYAYAFGNGMVPNMNNMPNYQPQLGLHSPMQPYAATTSPTPAKVKITDKDGRQVDLEEKKKALATSSPGPSHSSVASSSPAVDAEHAPLPKAANPTSASSVSTPAAAPAPASSKSNEVAEEFRKKILEKARLAKLKKEEEKRLAEASASNKDEPKSSVTAEKKEEKPAVVEAAAPSTTEEPKPTEETHPAPEEQANVPAQTESAPEEPVIENAPTESTKTAPEESSNPIDSTSDKPKEEPVEVADVVEEPLDVKEPQQKDVEPAAVSAAPVEQQEPLAEEQAETQEAEETVEAEPEEEPTTVADDNEGEADAQPQNEDEEIADPEHEESSEPVFDLSMYFSRLEKAKPIEDPFSFSYPYPLAGVDPRWKAGEKKYRYDPQFLLQFREVVQYPIDDAWKEKLEGLGIVAGKRSSSGSQRMNSNKFGNQMQGRFGSMSGRPGQFDGRQNSRSGSKRRGGSNAGGPRDKSLRNRNQSKRGKDSRDREDDKPAEEVKPLVPSANRWVPRSRVKKDEVKTAPDGSIMLDEEDVERKTKSALNKLTLEMFEPITEELLTIAKQSRWEEDAKTIKQVISLTFAKACDEPYWSTVYAQFCAKMLKEISDDIKDVNTLTKTGEPATGGDLARRILLATCQSEYEKGWVDKLPTNPDGTPLEPEMMSDEYYAMAAAKRRGLGLVKFIGNLYILNMLNDQVILHCLRDQSKNVVDPSEDALENLAQLIKTVGPRFETSDRNKAALNMIYDNIQQILDNCKISSRIRFMLMDLQDLRKSNWKSIKSEAGPKTIKEIHNEAELKRIEDSRALAEKRRQNKSGYNSGNYNSGDSRSNSTRGGSSWGNRKEPRAPTKDSRGFTSVSRSQSNRPVPEQSASTSTMSPRENSKRTDSMASNIFAALDDEDAGH